MKVLVTGVNGQLGYDTAAALKKRGHIVCGTGTKECYNGVGDIADVADSYVQMDITDDVRVDEIFDMVKPDAVVHCAAWTAVDKAEDDERREDVMRVNADGTRNIAAACKRINAKCIYISTDYVFDGTGEEPWKPECTEYAPLNVYGLSKLEGEKAVQETLDRYFIVRISWVYGINGGNFVKTMFRLAQTHDTLKVVCDQIGRPTYTKDLAELLVKMAESDRYGIYHASNSGEYISWYDFACEIFKSAGLKVNVIPVTTAEYGVSKAVRPMNSRLDTIKLEREGFGELPEWRDALKRFINDIM